MTDPKRSGNSSLRASRGELTRIRARKSRMETFFATCPRGLELLLAEELRQLKAEKIHVVGGGVEFGGDFWLSYRINLESRIASRVLWQAATGRYRNENDIYRDAARQH